MKNVITQPQFQSQMIPMERTHTLKSHFCASGIHPTRKLSMREPMEGGIGLTSKGHCHEIFVKREKPKDMFKSVIICKQ